MKKIFLLLILSLSFVLSRAQLYSCKEGTVSFFSEAPLENIDAINRNINSFLNFATDEVIFLLPIRGFEFDRDLMEEHFNEKYLESDKYPNATFRGKITEKGEVSKPGIHNITVTGKLTMHGVENEITVPGVVITAEDTIKIRSLFTIALKDYKIKVPKLVFQNIAETVTVKVNAAYTIYKKDEKK
ncbi:MAG TPA: YceI family protein [Bacteroidia bacterium]|nr:YceI family protein [Bacteroidia bacterium]